MLEFRTLRQARLPSEEELDVRHGEDPVDAWLPNLSVDREAAAALSESNLRAGVTVRLGVLALANSLHAVERSLAGRTPHVWVEEDRLRVRFNVGDESEHAWIKVVDEGWALADAFGGDVADLLNYHISKLDRPRRRQ